MTMMGYDRNKYQSCEDRRRINTMLMRDWDPIGLGDICPVNEYQTYADKAYVMLMGEKASAEDVATYLIHIATGHMGLLRSEQLTQRSERIAIMLVNIRSKFKLH